MIKDQAPRQQKRKEENETMQILSKILSRGKNACPPRRKF
jgi:hypothetical protein